MMEPVGDKMEDIEWDAIKEDDDDWKKRRAVPLVELKKRGSQGSTFSSYFTMYTEGHTRIMASLVPDEIIYNIGDYSKRIFEGCLLFGDVSGFTDLCEKYNKSGKGGPSRLTQVLNNYIGAMVQEIMSHGGDVLKFSGDAFIALWKVTDHLSMRDAVHEAIDCSLVIQKSYGTYHTDVDVVVRVKLAVSCGEMLFSLVGNSESSHYLMSGEPILGIKEAEHRSSAGEIVITARVSRHISANEYMLNVFPDGLHAKVLGVGPSWRNTQRQFEDTEAYQSIRDLEGESVASLTTESQTTVSNMEDDSGIINIQHDQYALRPAVNHAARLKLMDDLRKFIIAPVMRGIDASEPLEYLTEIRKVAILFLNCKMSNTIVAVESIDVADKIYITVCDIVKNQYGCVNKISNFDKDLMLLVIFGLRGFKHELESQIALKCALESYDKIRSMKAVVSISAGVTTGSCYCGAFGHTLRREYTVIGLVVNKAARLMVAYPNKVTCDRNTFLYSKLEARNFMLQEFKPLKGIVNPGPIYEFKEVERTQDLAFSISPMPLLGRKPEIEMYEKLMLKARLLTRKNQNKLHFVNMLMFRGDFRQGKTRLLEEVLFHTDPSIPIHTMVLTSADQEVNFRIIQLIFHHFIGAADKSSRTSRERKLKVRLESQKVNHLHHLLNPVFDVKFEVTGKEENSDDSLKIIFAMLSRTCFSKFWVIAIDDADYIDDKSWSLILLMLEMELVFFVVTMGIRKQLSPYAAEAITNSHIEVAHLKPIDNWFIPGIVCQMLNIQGIPPELNKVIQMKSNGNPGWIESFLVTLMQSGGLIVKEMTRIKAYNQGFVLPALYMLMRLTQEETEMWRNVMEERIFSPDVDEEVLKRWKIFVTSCRESFSDIPVMKQFQEMKKDYHITVCYLNPSFNLDEVEPEHNIDVVILQTFDSLSSYEQLLLKCSSVLGDTFPRDMLLYIMSSTASRLIALAVCKLFEIHVLSCARGNFIEGGLNFKDRLVDPNEDETVKCECAGLLIDDNCIDLPKYASCGYLRFRSSEFRETTYNLLTDNQKREFHGKAIRYMEKETRRCRACGSGYFTRYLGTGRLDQGLRSRRKSKHSKSIISQDSATEIGYDTKSSLTGSQTGSKSISISHSLRTGQSIRGSASSAGVDAVSMGMGSSLHAVSGLGLTTIRKLKDNYNLVRTFSSYDYSHCTCSLILNTMYSHLIEHSKGAGLVEKIMTATIEYAYVCMDNKNAPQAIRVLEEALELLDGPMKDQIELDWMIPLKRGKLLTLIGRARMLLEDDDAYVFFTEALKHYGITFPTTRIGKCLLKSRFKLKHYMRLYFYTRKLPAKMDEDLAEYCNNVSECLHLLCKFFIKKRRWKEAELAALWSLKEAVRTETDFEVTCLAYALMIHISAVASQVRFGIALEVFAFRMCHRKKTIVELEELKAVFVLYFHIGTNRLMRGELDKAMMMSFPIWTIANASRSQEMLFNVFPALALATLLRKQVIEFGNILQEMSYSLESDADISGKFWYHALCLQLHLDMGFVAEAAEKWDSFIHNVVLNENVRDTSSRMRLIISKWLWEIRNDNWEAATIWQKTAWSYTCLEKGENIVHLLTGLYLLEGFIIYMVNKMDMKNHKAAEKANRHILKLIKKLEVLSSHCLILKPRLYHLRAYYVMAKYNNFKEAMKFIKKCRKLAEEQHNDLDIDWATHSEMVEWKIRYDQLVMASYGSYTAGISLSELRERIRQETGTKGRHLSQMRMAWSNKLPSEDRFSWRVHCEEGNGIYFTDVDVFQKRAYYTLPLPIYI